MVESAFSCVINGSYHPFLAVEAIAQATPAIAQAAPAIAQIAPVGTAH